MTNSRCVHAHMAYQLAAVTAVFGSAYQAVDNSLGDGLLQLCAHMGDVRRHMRRNHLQELLARVPPIGDLSNRSA